MTENLPAEAAEIDKLAAAHDAVKPITRASEIEVALYAVIPGTPLADVIDERGRQIEKWGEQHHPDGTGGEQAEYAAQIARNSCQYAALMGTTTWALILREEVAEACAEVDAAALRAELVQVAAVAVAWIEDIDSRTGPDHG